MKIILQSLFFLITTLNFAQTIKWEDNMNGDNSIAGLQARNWVIINNDGGGVTDTWFQPGTSVFTSFEGHDSGFVASNFNGANDNGVIDHWLISPPIDVIPGDSLVFFVRSPDGSEFPDSIYILISLGSTSIPDFTRIGNRLEVPTNGWNSFYLTFNVTSEVRFAINYYIFNGGPEGSSGNFIGLDNFRLYTQGGVNYPENITLNKSFTFSNPESSSSYRLVGLPGNNNLAVTTFFSGEHKKDWNVFYDNGDAANFMIEFNGQATFNFTPGKGFWALSRNPVNVNRQVSTVSLLANNTFNIPLHSGWNIISNPFEKNVSFADIRNANGLAQNTVFFSFNGNFSQAATMVPYEGYYFMNPDGRGSLSIPYPFGSNLPKENTEPNLISSQNLELKLSSSDFSSQIIIGFDETAKNDYDIMDYFAPPGNFEELNIRLVNENLSTSYKKLFIEHRTEIGEGQSFNVQIKNSNGKNAKLSAEGIKNFSEHEVYFVDERLKKFYNLKEKNEINISGKYENSEFKLLIGSQGFINNYKVISAPVEFALHQNYPNPFNPVTLIRYQVPQKEHVSVKVYDIIGNLVKVLVNETKDEGYYEAEFDGTSLSSGIYLYEFISGPVRSIKKMTLIK